MIGIFKNVIEGLDSKAKKVPVGQKDNRREELEV